MNEQYRTLKYCQVSTRSVFRAARRNILGTTAMLSAAAVI